jgi:hypothetical protein
MTISNRIVILLVAWLLATRLTCIGAESPNRISIGPTNDLAAFVPLDHVTITARWPKWKVSEAYKSGWGIGTINGLRGHTNILVLDDGHANHDAFDNETGFPIIILIDAKLTRELQDMVQGYNLAMHQAWTRNLKSQR